jgi:copper(I)-binding protein
VKRPIVAALAAVALAAGACSSGSADSTDGLTVSDAWARTTPPGVSVGVVYLEVRSDTDDALLGATVDPSIAAKAQLHVGTASGDMTSMQPVSSMPVTPSEPLALGPLGDHLMLVDLAAPLTTGEHFDVTLHFRAAGDETVSVEVRDDAP